MSRRHDPIAESFGRSLHKRMFDKTWKWAGVYRRSDKNIGVEWTQIRVRLAEQLDNFHYWLEHGTFLPDELAVRFHHALVLIHPFPNGNGRWSRMMADVLMAKMEQPRLTWGGSSLTNADETRKCYIEALHAADAHNISPLLAFAKS